jgi:hypothetical protein
MSEGPAEDDIGRRARVWAALSNLFVDTDVSLLRQHIASELAATPYTEAELLQILRTEVGPVFFTNLLSIAGEWVGWTPEEARPLVLRYLRSPPPLRWLRRHLSGAVVERAIADHWASIRALRILAREP